MCTLCVAYDGEVAGVFANFFSSLTRHEFFDGSHHVPSHADDREDIDLLLQVAASDVKNALSTCHFATMAYLGQELFDEVYAIRASFELDAFLAYELSIGTFLYISLFKPGSRRLHTSKQVGNHEVAKGVVVPSTHEHNE